MLRIILPKNLKIFIRETEVEYTIPSGTITGNKVMVCDASKPNTFETAESWAKCGHYWNHKEAYKISTVDVPNDSISNLQIAHIERRSQGGRAYKVVDLNTKYIYDLREPAIEDIMLTDGIKPGGIISSKLVWVKNHTTMTLVRVGSENYKEAKSTPIKLPDKIKMKDLKQFHIYRHTTDKYRLHVYLGRIRDRNNKLVYGFVTQRQFPANPKENTIEINELLRNYENCSKVYTEKEKSWFRKTCTIIPKEQYHNSCTSIVLHEDLGRLSDEHIKLLQEAITNSKYTFTL